MDVYDLMVFGEEICLKHETLYYNYVNTFSLKRSCANIYVGPYKNLFTRIMFPDEIFTFENLYVSNINSKLDGHNWLENEY